MPANDDSVDTLRKQLDEVLTERDILAEMDESARSIHSALVRNIQGLCETIQALTAQRDEVARKAEELHAQLREQLFQVSRDRDILWHQVDECKALGYEWRWTRSIDADGKQEGAWFKVREPITADIVARLRAVLHNDRSVELIDRKSTRLNSSHIQKSRMPSSA